MRDRRPRVRHLPVAGLTAELSDRFDEQEDAERARVGVRQPAAGGLRRLRAPGPRRPSATNAPPSPLAQNPRSSSASSTVMVNESYSSTTSMSDGWSPLIANAR